MWHCRACLPAKAPACSELLKYWYIAISQSPHNSLPGTSSRGPVNHTTSACASTVLQDLQPAAVSSNMDRALPGSSNRSLVNAQHRTRSVQPFRHHATFQGHRTPRLPQHRPATCGTQKLTAADGTPVKVSIVNSATDPGSTWLSHEVHIRGHGIFAYSTHDPL